MKRSQPSLAIHPFPPVYDGQSRLLILGSFPSVKSRENGFYYGNPGNRFWPVLASILNEPLPHGNEEKKALLLKNGIALWDCIASCEITGSSDSSIRDAVPNDIASLLQKTQIKAVFTNGKAADAVYRKYVLPQTGIEAVCLPSTSPANASYTLERLRGEWAKAANRSPQ